MAATLSNTGGFDMAAYKCTHCGEDIWGIAVPMKGSPLRYQHLHCYMIQADKKIMEMK